MDSSIPAAVNKTNLNLKENVGKKFRITKSGIRGSLWLERQTRRYRLKLTGEIAALLSRSVTIRLDEEPSEDQGSPIWHLPFDGSMEAVVAELDKF